MPTKKTQESTKSMSIHSNDDEQHSDSPREYSCGSEETARKTIDSSVLNEFEKKIAKGMIPGKISHSALQEDALQPVIFPEDASVIRTTREKHQGHAGTVLWLTGLPAAGKSTIARLTELRLFESGFNALVLDADNIRRGLCADLGFNAEDRSENVRRIAHVARLFLEAGHIVIVSCISPFAHDREVARNIVGLDDFHEIFLDCPIEVCRNRDPKGLYARALRGEFSGFTGVDSEYQTPSNPVLTLLTAMHSSSECSDVLVKYTDAIFSRRMAMDVHRQKRGCDL